MRMNQKRISPGMYLQGELGIRRVGKETDHGFEYLQFHAGARQASYGCCSNSALRAWGRPISEAEARGLIPNIDEQEGNLLVDQRKRGLELAATLELAVIAVASDDVLIAELERRGYTISKSH